MLKTLCSKAIDIPCNTETFVKYQKTIIKFQRFQVLYKLSLLRVYAKSAIFHPYNGRCINFATFLNSNTKLCLNLKSYFFSKYQDLRNKFIFFTFKYIILNTFDIWVFF